MICRTAQLPGERGKEFCLLAWRWLLLLGRRPGRAGCEAFGGGRPSLLCCPAAPPRQQPALCELGRPGCLTFRFFMGPGPDHPSP